MYYIVPKCEGHVRKNHNYWWTSDGRSWLLFGQE